MRPPAKCLRPPAKCLRPPAKCLRPPAKCLRPPAKVCYHSVQHTEPAPQTQSTLHLMPDTISVPSQKHHPHRLMGGARPPWGGRSPPVSTGPSSNGRPHRRGGGHEHPRDLRRHGEALFAAGSPESCGAGRRARPRHRHRRRRAGGCGQSRVDGPHHSARLPFRQRERHRRAAGWGCQPPYVATPIGGSALWICLRARGGRC